MFVCRLLQQHSAICLYFQLFTLTFSFGFLSFFLHICIIHRKNSLHLFFKTSRGHCGKSDVVDEIRTGFLAVFLTSFNFSTPV